jgi:hypothetical protein
LPLSSLDQEGNPLRADGGMMDVQMSVEMISAVKVQFLATFADLMHFG